MKYDELITLIQTKGSEGCKKIDDNVKNAFIKGGVPEYVLDAIDYIVISTTALMPVESATQSVNLLYGLCTRLYKLGYINGMAEIKNNMKDVSEN